MRAERAVAKVLAMPAGHVSMSVYAGHVCITWWGQGGRSSRMNGWSGAGRYRMAAHYLATLRTELAHEIEQDDALRRQT